MSHTFHRRWLGLALVPIVALGACGDDDESAATTAAPAPTAASTSAGANPAAFCTSSLAIAQATTAAPPVEPGDVAAGKAFAATVLPLGQELLAAAPVGLKGDLEQMVAVTEAAAGSGDVSGFQTPEFLALDAKVHAAGVESCDWAVQDVELMDYHLMGLPETLTAGVTSFELTNTGKELHEMVVVRKNDGITESFEELLALGEEEAFAKITPVGGAFAAPGQQNYLLADLAPGEYLAICFVPVGTVDMTSGPPADAPPHFTQGMQHEFTVS